MLKAFEMLLNAQFAAGPKAKGRISTYFLGSWSLGPCGRACADHDLHDPAKNDSTPHREAGGPLVKEVIVSA